MGVDFNSVAMLMLIDKAQNIFALDETILYCKAHWSPSVRKSMSVCFNNRLSLLLGQTAVVGKTATVLFMTVFR